MSIGSIYIARRRLVTFLCELLWLALSSMLLVVITCLAQREALIPILVLAHALLITAVYVATFYMMDLYVPEQMKPHPALLLSLVRAVGIIFIGFGLLTLATQQMPFAPPLLLTQAALTVLLVIFARSAIDRSHIAVRSVIRIGVVARATFRRRLEEEIRQRHDLQLRLEWLGDSLEQASFALSQAIHLKLPLDRLMIDSGLLTNPYKMGILQTSRGMGIQPEELQPFAERTFGKVFMDPQLTREIAWASLVSISKVSRILRRMRDLAVATTVLVLSLPVCLVLAAAIKCDSPGPVFFVQERIGKNGRPFKMLKFRSMFHGALSAGPRGWTTRERDPRITRVGSMMRLLHLDELPQIINVLRGEMSTVGPRPFHPDQVKELELRSPYFALRQLVMPGMTGWAQICCDYEASVDNSEEVLSRDLYYIKHGSLLFDALIMAETLRVCLWRQGAR